MSPAVTMAGAITALVTEKRATGYKYDAEERVLARFAAFCASQFPGLEAPDRASVEAWIAAARQRGVKPATLHGLAAPVRELARWLGRRGVPAYVLPGGALPRPARYLPHIYTDQELAALFAQTDRCHYDSQVPFRHLVMPVLFRTIYACGLRASEARLLRFGDVDAETGVLAIRDGKGGKDRQVPVSAPLRERLATYHAQIAGRTGGDWFFPGRKGLPLTLMNVNRNFRRFLAGPHSHGGQGHGPSPRSAPHDGGDVYRSMVRRGESAGALLSGPAGLHRVTPRSRHRLLPEAGPHPTRTSSPGSRLPSGTSSRPSRQGRAMATDFAVCLQRFLTSHLAGLRGCSPNTIASYRDTFKLLIVFFGDVRSIPPDRLTLDRIDAAAIAGFLDWLETERHNSISTRNQRLGRLSSFFRWLQSQDPARMAELPGHPRRPGQNSPAGHEPPHGRAGPPSARRARPVHPAGPP